MALTFWSQPDEGQPGKNEAGHSEPPPRLGPACSMHYAMHLLVSTTGNSPAMQSTRKASLNGNKSDITGWHRLHRLHNRRTICSFRLVASVPISTPRPRLTHICANLIGIVSTFPSFVIHTKIASARLCHHGPLCPNKAPRCDAPTTNFVYPPTSSPPHSYPFLFLSIFFAALSAKTWRASGVHTHNSAP